MTPEWAVQTVVITEAGVTETAWLDQTGSWWTWGGAGYVPYLGEVSL